MTDGTAGMGNMQPVRIEAVLNAMREIEMLPKPDQWILIDPYGRMYRGKVEQVMPFLAKQHPLCKVPISLGRIDGR